MGVIKETVESAQQDSTPPVETSTRATSPDPFLLQYDLSEIGITLEELDLVVGLLVAVDRLL